MKKVTQNERLKTATQKQNQIIDTKNPDHSYALKLAREKGASSWLNALPIEKHELWLTKLEFGDDHVIRYGWDLKNVLSTCACGSPFVLSNALNGLKWGYPIIRHNEIRDFFANWMKKLATTLKSNHLCSLSTTRHLQTLPASMMRQDSTSPPKESGAAVLSASFYYVKIFNPYAPTNRIKDTKDL